MTPGARIQAVIELLDSILLSWQSEKRIPADKLIDNYFKARRYIGSKDRAYIGELAYWCLRNKAALEWYVSTLSRRERGGVSLGEGGEARVRAEYVAPPSPRPSPDGRGRLLTFIALMLRKDYTHRTLPGVFEDAHAPAPLTKEEEKLCAALQGQPLEHPDMPEHVRLNYPEWMSAMLHARFENDFEEALRALNAQAPTDLRVNTLKTNREQLQKELHAQGFDVAPSALSPWCLRLAKRAPVFTSPLFKEGHFEVQDEGSQLLALLTDAQPGMRVIDFCAGAGGKTLAMAAMMKNKGRILAWDTSEKRLKQMNPRLRRAGVDNVQTHVIASEHDAFIKRHKGTADRVLVDAPCSGSGTWRRNPDLKWRFTRHDLDEVLAVQQSILESASRLVKPGGRLIYATCSIFRDENEAQVKKFLTSRNNFTVVCAQKIWNKNAAADMTEPSQLQLAPHKDGADGFFATVLEQKAN